MKNAKKRKIINVMPEIYSLNFSDYAKFFVQKSASERMYDNWNNVGLRLAKSIKKVGSEIAEK